MIEPVCVKKKTNKNMHSERNLLGVKAWTQNSVESRSEKLFSHTAKRACLVATELESQSWLSVAIIAAISIFYFILFFLFFFIFFFKKTKSFKLKGTTKKKQNLDWMKKYTI
jgi:hypothetical protein